MMVNTIPALFKENRDTTAKYALEELVMKRNNTIIQAIFTTNHLSRSSKLKTRHLKSLPKKIEMDQRDRFRGEIKTNIPTAENGILFYNQELGHEFSKRAKMLWQCENQSMKEALAKRQFPLQTNTYCNIVS